MGHASHFPEFYGPQTPEEYAAQQHQDDVEAYYFVQHQQEAPAPPCPICAVLRAIPQPIGRFLDGLKTQISLHCQCVYVAGFHAVSHPHPCQPTGCEGFQGQKE